MGFIGPNVPVTLNLGNFIPRRLNLATYLDLIDK